MCDSFTFKKAAQGQRSMPNMLAFCAVSLVVFDGLAAAGASMESFFRLRATQRCPSRTRKLEQKKNTRRNSFYSHRSPLQPVGSVVVSPVLQLLLYSLEWFFLLLRVPATAEELLALERKHFEGRFGNTILFGDFVISKNNSSRDVTLGRQILL